MKILQLAIHYPPQWGGIETLAHGLARHMIDRGHEVQALCCHNSVAMQDREEFEGVTVHRMALIQGVHRKDPRAILLSKKIAKQVAHEFQPDVIHLHGGGINLFSYTACPELMAVPTLLTMHDFPEEDSFEMPTVDQIFSIAKRITLVSDIRLKDAQRLYPGHIDRMQRIYNSKANLPNTLPAERSDTPLILMVGRQVHKKGFDLAIQAFAQVASNHPTAQLVLIGDGEEHQALRQLAQQCAVQERIHFTGAISEEELSQWYRRSWISLVPSRHSESFGLVALEAMQNGNVVLASRAGGLPEVVAEGETGLLFEVGQTDEMASLMNRLLDHPEQLMQMAKASVRRAEDVFGYDSFMEAYEKLYHKVATP